MDNTARKYEEMMAQILLNRRFGTMSEDEEDELLEKMDDLWLEMTEKERQDYDERAARSKASGRRIGQEWKDRRLVKGESSGGARIPKAA